jgi:hypothetical protein
VSRSSTNFEEILSLAHGNFEVPKKTLNSSMTAINYCIIIISAYYYYYY